MHEKRKKKTRQNWINFCAIIAVLFLIGVVNFVIKYVKNKSEKNQLSEIQPADVFRGPQGGCIIRDLPSPAIVLYVTAEEMNGGNQVYAKLENPVVHLHSGKEFLRLETLRKLSWERSDDHKAGVLPLNPRWGILYTQPKWAISLIQ
jgi:hypothetical protein